MKQNKMMYFLLNSYVFDFFVSVFTFILDVTQVSQNKEKEIIQNLQFYKK